MIASPTNSLLHLTDGVLLALHDQERGDKLDAGRTHIEHCAECRARLEAIGAHSARVRSALTSMSVPSVSEGAFRRRIASARRPIPLWRRPTWQAAAALVVLAGAAAASPVRDWIRRHIEHSDRNLRPAAPAIIADSARPLRAGATVSFAPVGGAFTLRLDSVPEAGSVNATTTNAATISARVADGAGTGGDDMVVLPGELRVRNGSSARASYELSLPGMVTRLRVIVGGRTIFDGPPPVTLPLVRTTR